MTSPDREANRMSDKKDPLHHDPEAGIPRSALIPGLLGLIPFLVLSWSSMHPTGLMSMSQALMALNIYSAIILTFIGALWWGLGARMPDSFIRSTVMVWSVIPAIFSWLATLLSPRTAHEALLGGFIVQWIMDSILVYVAASAMPHWVYKLRTILTIIACAIMTFTAWYIH